VQVYRLVFNNFTTFNSDISGWDVSNVTGMGSMFNNTTFNSGINDWGVSSVTNMTLMFWESNYNQPLNNWDVSRVSDMSYMFSGATTFFQDLSGWTVNTVINCDNFSYGNFPQPNFTNCNPN